MERMSKFSMIKTVKEHTEFSLFIGKNVAMYFDSFRIENIPQEVLNKIKDKSIATYLEYKKMNLWIICGFYCIAFIEYMCAGKAL